MKKILPLLLLSTALYAGTPDAAYAGSFEQLGSLPGGTSSQVYGISPDGKIAVGTASVPGGFEAYYWTKETGMVSIGDLPAGTLSGTARDMSADGTVIVGRGNGVNGSEAFIWKAGIYTPLGDLPGGTFSSQAIAVSDDGTIVAGIGAVAAPAFTQVFRWTALGGMINIGSLGGNGIVNFGGMSGDGNVIVGTSTTSNGAFNEAFRWTPAGGPNGTMVGLGDFAGGIFNSGANGVSRDGAVIVGYGTTATGQEAFRWTQTTGMVALGDLDGGAISSAATATNLDGSVIVGTGTTALGIEGFYWSQTGGMQLLADAMADAGANLTGWSSIYANALSDDGNVMVGRGQNGGTTRAFIMNFLDGAIANPEDLGKSLNTVAQAGQQSAMSAMNYMPQGLFAAQNLASISTPISTSSFNLASSSPSDLQGISPAAGDYIVGGASGLSFFMLGSFGAGQNNDFDNDQLSGTAGLTATVADDLELGIGVITGRSNMVLDFGGESRMDALGGMTLASYAPHDYGLRLYATAYAARISMDIERGYLNGGSPDRSNGKTDGISYGGAAKIGWETALSDDTSIMPYVEARYAKTNIDAYSESGGSFAAKFSEQKSDYATSRLGFEVKHQVDEALEVIVRPAWGHRITDDGGSFTADINGLGQSLSWNAGDRDWAEVSVGATWRTTENAAFSAEVTARSGDTAETAVNVIIGTNIKF